MQKSMYHVLWTKKLEIFEGPFFDICQKEWKIKQCGRATEVYFYKPQTHGTNDALRSKKGQGCDSIIYLIKQYFLSVLHLSKWRRDRPLFSFKI